MATRAKALAMSRPAWQAADLQQSPPCVLHLIVGPAEHGVVRHAISVAKACGDEILQVSSAADCRIPHGYDVVHVPYTDRLFGVSAESSAAAFCLVAEAVLATGASLSTTLHDAPSGDDPLALRRRQAYARIVSRASGVVVASNAELVAAERLNDRARSRRVIPLPVVASASSRCAPAGTEVAVLGFVYPDRGYEQVIAALPEGMGITALGRAADGHDDLADTLRRSALRAGRTWELTGFLADDVLRHRLRRVAVPVAPNRRTGASASIATWLEHGRRPLVPVSAYTRELDRRWPDTLRLYDPDRPGELRAAIEQAYADPASTLLEPGVKPGASEAEVAAAYASHFRACARAAVVPVGAGRYTVPDNRWDLLADYTPEQPPTVSVVIPYYDAPEQLRLVLHALTLQSHPATRLEVIVADDGSAQPPPIDSAGSLTVRMVRQEDHGFRAAAARNLGAAAASGDVLLFLDADTVPEPEYVQRLARLPALSSDALVVGRRRHADLRKWAPDDLTEWLCRGGRGPVEFTEPQWLRDGYRWSHNLLDVDARSYRYVISAVLGLTRDLFDEIGGFCEQFTSYGGEDWELAHRAYCAGALFAHVPDAIAWHDGPEWAERAIDRERIKAVETRRLRRLLPDAVARGPGQWLPYPSVVIRMNAAEPDLVRAGAQSAFASGMDCGIWLTGPSGDRVAAQLRDQRIQAAPVPADVLQRCLFVVDLDGPANLAALPELLTDASVSGELQTAPMRIRTTRAVSRARRHSATFGGDADAALQALFGRQDSSASLPHMSVHS